AGPCFGDFVAQRPGRLAQLVEQLLVASHIHLLVLRSVSVRPGCGGRAEGPPFGDVRGPSPLGRRGRNREDESVWARRRARVQLMWTLSTTSWLSPAAGGWRFAPPRPATSRACGPCSPVSVGKTNGSGSSPPSGPLVPFWSG